MTNTVDTASAGSIHHAAAPSGQQQLQCFLLFTQALQLSWHCQPSAWTAGQTCLKSATPQLWTGSY